MPGGHSTREDTQARTSQSTRLEAPFKRPPLKVRYCRRDKAHCRLPLLCVVCQRRHTRPCWRTQVIRASADIQHSGHPVHTGLADTDWQKIRTGAQIRSSGRVTMDISKTPPPLSSLDTSKQAAGYRVPVTGQTRPAPRETTQDRRRQPDRRRRQEAFAGPDRRRRNTRRRPLLLNPRTRQEAPLEDRRGRLIETSA